MTTLSRSKQVIQKRQRAISGKYTCGPRPVKSFGTQWVQPCPHYAKCRALPLSEDALCELSDGQAGIDTMTEPRQTGWQLELVVKAAKVIPDPLYFEGDEDE